MWPIVRRGLPWVGRTLAFVGVVFVVLRLRDYAGQFDVARLDLATWLLIVVLIVSYGAANIMLALAWWSLLSRLGVHISWRLGAGRVRCFADCEIRAR